MPGYDGTGPLGTGLLGRGMGPCGNGVPRWGKGRGFGRFGGFGWRSASFNSLDDEKEMLKTQKTWLEDQAAQIEQRLKSLDSNEKK